MQWLSLKDGIPRLCLPSIPHAGMGPRWMSSASIRLFHVSDDAANDGRQPFVCPDLYSLACKNQGLRVAS